MSQGAWLREAQNDLAVERILTAAGAAFARLGIAGVTMSDVAREAGCSRGTVYRYFKTRDELLIAYVTERARTVSAEVAKRTADIADPRDRLVATILDSVREVRRRPDLAAWFEADQAGHTARLSRRPELFDALAAGFGPAFAASADDHRPRRAAMRFVVRVVVSLLAMPEESEEAERVLVSRFVVPGILGPRRSTPVDEP